MTRRCSHCSNNGHNSRTCPTRAAGLASGGGGGPASGAGVGGGGVKLFGVRLTDGSLMKKSKSMGNLSHYHSSLAASPNPSSPSSDHLRDAPSGYLSDDPIHASCSSNRRSERKKGKPWTEEEHRLFLIGLQKLGRGDWRGIARNYVVSRTPTQVASHAQKYFIRQSNATRRKRRSSLFDMVPDMATTEPQTVPEEELLPPPAESGETDNTNSVPSTDLSLSRETEPMEATSTEEAKEPGATMVLPDHLAPAGPAFFLPFPYPQLWPHCTIQPEEDNKGQPPYHQVLKPTPILRKEPVNVDELVGMSRLNLSETENGHIVPPQLSLGLLGTPSRQSAFHVSAPAARSAELNEGKNSAIQAA